jgi:ribosomal protein S14
MSTFTPDKSETPDRVLNRGKDRCDRCGAEAFVLAKGLSGELLFCGHHFAKMEAGLVAWAYEILDERDLINEKGGAST